MSYYVYVLQSLKETFFYKGMTSDLEKRLAQHNSGMTPSNRRVKPFKLVFVQVCDTVEEARKLEKYLKSGFGREIIQEITSPRW